MQPDVYGPFPYVPINRRPKWRWPNGARVALWVAPSLEFFPLKVALAGQPWQKASEQQAPTVRAWGQRDYGNRIGGLDAALKYICAQEDVWLATGEDIVRAYLASGAAI